MSNDVHDVIKTTKDRRTRHCDSHTNVQYGGSGVMRDDGLVVVLVLLTADFKGRDCVCCVYFCEWRPHLFIQSVLP